MADTLKKYSRAEVKPGNLAPETEDAEAREANATECLDCGHLARNPRSWEECPNDGEHFVEPLFLTHTALGFDDDQDFWHHGREQYEYPARTPR